MDVKPKNRFKQKENTRLRIFLCINSKIIRKEALETLCDQFELILFIWQKNNR